MATNRGTRFKSLVVDLIYLEERKKRKYEQVKAFLLKADEYYDIFCDNIYLFTLNDNMKALSIDNNGLTHNHHHDNSLIVILTRDDYNPVFNDISTYIDIALSRMEAAKLGRIKENVSNVDLF